MKKLLFLSLFFLFAASAYSQDQKIIITEAFGKKLITPAHFSVGNKKVWVLDYRNGSKISYTIIALNKHNTLCGIQAVDSNGDSCEICFISQGGGTMVIEFKYSPSMKLIMKGKYAGAS